MQGDWIILRCSGPSTLKLAHSLTTAGFDVWTPTTTLTKRQSGTRSRLRRTMAATPTYLFARARHLHSLFAESNSPTSQHPSFRIFHHNDRIPLIEDSQLDPLRIAHQVGQPTISQFSKGDIVRCSEAGLQGLKGEVEKIKGKTVTVAFPGLTIQIKSFMLLADNQQLAA